MTKGQILIEWFTLKFTKNAIFGLIIALSVGSFVPFSNAGESPLLKEKFEHPDWSPEVGDTMLVDTKENIGYLIHHDGTYIRFQVITGQKRVVHYIGRTYKATTPTWKWKALSNERKGDKVTFGPSGRFLRLFKDGTEYTPYGIHEHRDEYLMFPRESRYQSMGCIIVQSAMLDIIEATYAKNGNTLDVETVYGLSPEWIAVQ